MVDGHALVPGGGGVAGIARMTGPPAWPAAVSRVRLPEASA